jgi:hypothetical protein
LARVVADIPAEFQWQLKIPEPPPWTLFDFLPYRPSAGQKIT